MSDAKGSASGLLPILPLLYVAWSDGNLDLEELRAICGRVLDVWKLAPEDRELVGRWLDPDQTPSRRELDGMLARVRGASAGLSADDRRTLTELTLALARLGGGGVSQEERVAIERIERALGARGSRARREVLGGSPFDEDPE